MAETTNWRLKVLYDGHCPVCATEMNWLKKRAAKRNASVAFEDYTARDFGAAAYGITIPELHARMTAVLPDGTLVTGVEVFRRLYAELGLGWLLAWSRLPGLSAVAELGYGAFARLRPFLTGTKFCADGSCAVPNRKPASTSGPGKADAAG